MYLRDSFIYGLLIFLCSSCFFFNGKYDKLTKENYLERAHATSRYIKDNFDSYEYVHQVFEDTLQQWATNYIDVRKYYAHEPHIVDSLILFNDDSTKCLALVYELRHEPWKSNYFQVFKGFRYGKDWYIVGGVSTIAPKEWVMENPYSYMPKEQIAVLGRVHNMDRYYKISKKGILTARHDKVERAACVEGTIIVEYDGVPTPVGGRICEHDTIKNIIIADAARLYKGTSNPAYRKYISKKGLVTPQERDSILAAAKKVKNKNPDYNAYPPYTERRTSVEFNQQMFKELGIHWRQLAARGLRVRQKFKNEK